MFSVFILYPTAVFLFNKLHPMQQSNVGISAGSCVELSPVYFALLAVFQFCIRFYVNLKYSNP